MSLGNELAVLPKFQAGILKAHCRLARVGTDFLPISPEIEIVENYLSTYLSAHRLPLLDIGFPKAPPQRPTYATCIQHIPVNSIGFRSILWKVYTCYVFQYTVATRGLCNIIRASSCFKFGGGIHAVYEFRQPLFTYITR